MKPEAKNEAYTTISQLPAGTWGIVHTLTGGRQFTNRLASLGFTAGAAVEVRQNYGFGPVLIWVRGTLVALGRVEASRVFVQSGG